ncbi:MFS transporter [Candidatus Woesearchaeota archaeon]|nr:MFS transporter [Candidatus Woesearchaeota archaeon]
MDYKKEYFTIFTIMVTEVLGFSLILPFLPFYAQDLGASPFVVGLLLTCFSFFQFLSAPIMGRLSDHYGRKPLLFFSQLSTFISFLVLGFSNSLWMIFLSRIIDGLLGSNFTIAQAYLSDISSKKNRSKAFGLSGAAFGIGFLIGPATGGFLSQYGYGVPAFIAAGMSFITILTTIFLLPETVKRKKDVKINLKIFHFNDFKKYFSNKKISPKLGTFFSYILTHVIWVSLSALYAERQLGFNAQDMGFYLTYVGLISVILRGFLLGRLIDFFGEKKLQFFGAASMILGLLAASIIKEPWMFLVVMTFFASGSGLLRPLLIGSVSRLGSEKEQGALMGVTNSLGSLAQIFGPMIGGAVINYLFPGCLGLVAGFVMVIGLVMMAREEKRKNNKRVNKESVQYY